jgi:hypothetical protein
MKALEIIDRMRNVLRLGEHISPQLASAAADELERLRFIEQIYLRDNNKTWRDLAEENAELRLIVEGEPPPSAREPLAADDPSIIHPGELR